MVYARHTASPVLKAMLILSALIHGLVLLALNLNPEPEPQNLRMVAKINLVDEVSVRPRPTRTPSRPRPEFRVAPPEFLPPSDRASSGGGEPAPANRSLRQGPPRRAMRLDLPRSQGNRSPNSNVLRDMDQDGGETGHPLSTGDPLGTGGMGEGGDGTGGYGGGWGGGGEGGAPGGGPEGPERMLRLGCIRCGQCHVIDEYGVEMPENQRPMPANLYNLDHLGWDVKGSGHPVPARFGEDYLHALYEFDVEPDGRTSKIRVLRSSQDPKEKEALNLFAQMHKWTPPGKKVLIRTDYRIYREPKK